MAEMRKPVRGQSPDCYSHAPPPDEAQLPAAVDC